MATEIELLPINKKTPSPFTGWQVSPQGPIRYQNVIKTDAVLGFVHRYTDPDGVYRYLSKGTLTHWSPA